ncbi:MAG TPA: septum formation initiator family protein [Polyangiaceae bacterium]|jgi:cell division protein FtsB
MLERLLPITILVASAVGAPVLMLAPEGVPRWRSLSHELGEVEAESSDLRREIQELRSTVQRLRQDPVAVERIARDELGLVRSTELVFQFPRQP